MVKNNARETDTPTAADVEKELEAINEVINSTEYRENIRMMVLTTSGELLDDDEISGAIENFKTIAWCEFVASHREFPTLRDNALKKVFNSRFEKAFDVVLSLCDYSWRRFSRATVSPDGNGGYCLVRPASAA